MTWRSLYGGKLPPLLQEAYKADEQIINSLLSDEGFDDLPSKGSIALAAMAIDGESAGDLMRMMEISQQEAGYLTEALIHGGYLDLQAVGNKSESRRTVVTDRGHAVINSVIVGIKVARYASFPFQEGDIIICTPPKSGTTWVQMICALLIFQNPDLPGPLHTLSPTLDPLGVPLDILWAQLAEQQHRRFIKTHLPLHSMTIDPRVTCIAIGRHPLDRAISLYYHKSNIGPELRDLQGVQVPERPGDAPRQDSQPRSTPREWLLEWIEKDSTIVIEQLSRAWSRREEPNIVFLHYADLSTDLNKEMRRLASRLGITVSDRVLAFLGEGRDIQPDEGQRKTDPADRPPEEELSEERRCILPQRDLRIRPRTPYGSRTRRLLQARSTGGTT